MRRRSNSTPVTRQEVGQANASFVGRRRAHDRQQELTTMQGTGLVARRTQALKMSTINWGAGTEHLANDSGSPHFERVKSRVGDVGLERMFQRNQRVHRLMERVGDHPDAIKPEQVIRRFAASGNRHGRLSVDRHVMRNAYDPANNSISLINPQLTHFAAHEFRHAYDHLTGRLDLNIPEHRLQSELNAFGTQVTTAAQLGVDAGINGRTAHAQARTYEGKPGYPGTLESSANAVDRWRR